MVLDTRPSVSEAAESNPPSSSPSVTFESITFSDGTTIALDPTDVVVLVGPNNAGKSLALRELEDRVVEDPEGIVVRGVRRLTAGTAEDFNNFVRSHARIRRRGSSWTIAGYRFSVRISPEDLHGYWPDAIQPFKQLFCLRLPTETRITDSDPVDAIAVLDEPPSHPIHILYMADHIESKMSGYFRRAFGEDLILYRAGGGQFPLLVGDRLVPLEGEDRTSSSYCERLRTSTVPLVEQGDGMRSFASVILHLLAPITPSILLLDEPEAFLHPPQARLLGEIISTEKSPRAQLFVATHSPDVLHGLIDVASEHLRILRMQREGSVNRIKELDKGLIREISGDPLMKYSSVMSGVFHERVIICEADADCMFYSSILDLTEVHGERQPDVLFVHASGKDRMAALAKALVALDVPVDVVADIDILNDTAAFGRVVESIGGDLATVRPLAEAVRKAIDEQKLQLTVDEIKNEINKELGRESSDGESAKPLRKSINAIFRKASPWDAVKQAGEAALPAGQATQQFQELLKLCKRMGLWIVPVGELEGFLRPVGGHGPRWVQQVIEERDLVSDPDLERARAFVREIWRSKQGSVS